MRDPNEIRQARAKKITEARSLLDLAEKETRDLTEEERGKYDGLLKEAEILLSSAEREERQKKLEDGLEQPKPGQKPGTPHPSDLGDEIRALEKYSICKAILAHSRSDWRQAGLELEASEEIEKRSGLKAAGFFAPWQVFAATERRRMRRVWEQRAIITTVSEPEIVATDLLAGSFIDLLRNRIVIVGLGAQVLNGLVGNVDIPRQSGGGSTTWLAAETTDVTEDPLTTDKVSLSPKTIAARTDMSRNQLLQSSPGIEDLVRNDLMNALAIAVDLGAIAGSGASGQPTGILNVAGIGNVDTAGANGGVLTWPIIVNLEAEMGNANALLGNVSYLTNTKVVAQLKRTEAFSSTGITLMDRGGGPRPLNSYGVGVTNSVPNNLTKGTATDLSALVIGNFNDLLIGEWGTLDVVSDPWALADRGGLVVRAFQAVDVQVRHPLSFAAVNDVDTDL